MHENEHENDGDHLEEDIPERNVVVLLKGLVKPVGTEHIEEDVESVYQKQSLFLTKIRDKEHTGKVSEGRQ